MRGIKLNLYILGMLEHTFLLGAAQIQKVTFRLRPLSYFYKMQMEILDVAAAAVSTCIDPSGHEVKTTSHQRRCNVLTLHRR